MIPHVLRNLSELDIENLMCGRITAQTMHEAAGRLLSKYQEAILIGSKGDLYTTNDRELADELNDMLEAARKMREANGGWVSVDKLIDQAQELDMGYEPDVPNKCWNCDVQFKGFDDMVADEGDIWICKKCSIEWDKDLMPFQAGGTGF